MEKTSCLVSIVSAFAEEGVRYEGTFEASSDRIRVSWTQPEEEKGQGGSRFLLSYRVNEKVLVMSRRGSADSDMTFQEGEKTEGVVRTSHGDFDLEMETFAISFFPEERDEEVEIEGRIYLVKTAELSYDLCFPQQDPMRNHMIFKVHLAKSENYV
ncbi:MAG: DUF1934 domain-containing protein [Clostridiales bacterium]|nr:DUF1934 domain-containing protein [Clostridiales bacterium]